MRNYIILNGINSNTITGLLIQELPPISKPKIRTQVDEIDGRDGDIVTKLGYAAYDKEITIGLYGDYDVDDVISFFDGEGTVVFSNEEDKFYNYQILEQIDFERLVRYKTATVTLHVQPFKYSNVENVKTFTITNEESITIRNSGNIYSKPAITLYGTGTINLSVNGVQLFVIELGDENHIKIDAAQMEATTDGNLMNRLVTGSYDNFMFSIGSNEITWSGTVTEIDIENYSRWI